MKKRQPPICPGRTREMVESTASQQFVRLGPALLAAMTSIALATPAWGEWGQFRGPNANGAVTTTTPYPTRIGPDQNVVWKVPLPPGHSSPVVVGDRIYLTADENGKLLTLALDRATGRTLWSREAPYQSLETVHQTGSHAQSTPAADSKRVVSFFGSSGLIAYDPDGKELWRLPMGPFHNSFGAGSSPILVDDWVILCQDHDTDSFLMAVDANTGQVVWRTDRSEFPRNYATPVLWESAGERQIVVAATLRAVGYDLRTGTERWTVRGLARIVNMTPTVSEDGTLYIAAWSPGADEADRIVVEPFDQLITQGDADKNGTLEESEVPDGPVRMRFDQIDRDKDGHITREEFEGMRRVFEEARNVMVAIRPGGKGDITGTHVLWEATRMLPYIPSPLVVDDLIVLVKNGGILTTFDRHDGKTLKSGRVAGNTQYYSSPVAADGKVYVISQRGELSVVSGTGKWEMLHQAAFHEDVYATPALVDGTIYLRTHGHLYAFRDQTVAIAP